ncbi:UNVERIFIED_CONTAM: hypothetical protein GTU68_052640 [Idotea baltica]|nr:hypothetical protein [Idotea baltica]
MSMELPLKEKSLGSLRLVPLFNLSVALKVWCISVSWPGDEWAA